MEKNTALAIKGLQSDRRIVDESNSGIGGRNQYFGKDQQYHKGQTRCPHLTLLVDYLNRALISSFSAASTYEDPSGAVPDLDAPQNKGDD